MQLLENLSDNKAALRKAAFFSYGSLEIVQLSAGPVRK
jgi:hypothetical protein